jgi:hypothetical protein
MISMIDTNTGGALDDAEVEEPQISTFLQGDFEHFFELGFKVKEVCEIVHEGEEIVGCESEE